jgi:hypothetical protein
MISSAGFRIFRGETLILGRKKSFLDGFPYEKVSFQRENRWFLKKVKKMFFFPRQIQFDRLRLKSRHDNIVY